MISRARISPDGATRVDIGPSPSSWLPHVLGGAMVLAGTAILLGLALSARLEAVMLVGALVLVLAGALVILLSPRNDREALLIDRAGIRYAGHGQQPWGATWHELRGVELMLSGTVTFGARVPLDSRMSLVFYPRDPQVAPLPGIQPQLHECQRGGVRGFALVLQADDELLDTLDCELGRHAGAIYRGVWDAGLMVRRGGYRGSFIGGGFPSLP